MAIEVGVSGTETRSSALTPEATAAKQEALRRGMADVALREGILELVPTSASRSSTVLDAVGGDVVALTPGAVLMMLRMRLEDVDGQIDGMMRDIATNTSRSEAIQERVKCLNQIKTALAAVDPEGNASKKLEEIVITLEGGRTVTADVYLNELGIDDLTVGGDDYREESEIEAELAAAERAIDESPRMDPNWSDKVGRRNELRHELATVRAAPAGYRGNQTLNQAGLDSYIDTVQSNGRKINSRNEMLMVQMQSAMQQRSQAVTMATQMVKSLNDSASAIAQNIGR